MKNLEIWVAIIAIATPIAGWFGGGAKLYEKWNSIFTRLERIEGVNTETLKDVEQTKTEIQTQFNRIEQKIDDLAAHQREIDLNQNQALASKFHQLDLAINKQQILSQRDLTKKFNYLKFVVGQIMTKGDFTFPPNYFDLEDD